MKKLVYIRFGICERPTFRLDQLSMHFWILTAEKGGRKEDEMKRRKKERD